MDFVVMGRDGTDAQAPERRKAARPEHLAALDAGKQAGHIRYAVATLDGDRMAGSVVIYRVGSRAELDRLLAEEPYVKHGVWVSVEVMPCRSAPQFA